VLTRSVGLLAPSTAPPTHAAHARPLDTTPPGGHHHKNPENFSSESFYPLRDRVDKPPIHILIIPRTNGATRFSFFPTTLVNLPWC
jgi:hypothetical protein